MATVAQIQANRLNAQKSTGPRTAEGKERASQNALKHGLLAREAVIQGEDPEEFELYREGMLQELTPAGAVETMLAERVVGLSWRLRRAERLQNAAFAALDEGEPAPLLEARHEEWKQLKGNEWDRGLSGLFDEDTALGKVVVADFAEARVLDRLLMYERRIESSLYRTMAQLRKEREARETTVAAELASFDAKGVSSLKCQVSSGEEVTSGTSDFRLPTSHFKPSKITPDGVTTNETRRATRPPAKTLHDQFRQTNPIARDQRGFASPLGREEAVPGSIGGGKCGIGVHWTAGDAAGSRSHGDCQRNEEEMAHGARNDFEDA
ncbi:MAG: hypothetical protein ABFE13_05800 [Phycisphaerales bacterium]